MDAYVKDSSKDTLLLVHGFNPRALDDFKDAKKKLEKRLKRKIKVVVLFEKRDKTAKRDIFPKEYDVIDVNTSSIVALEQALNPYIERLLAVVCREERGIPYFQYVIPFVPYVPSPTVESLTWATDKLSMRRRLRNYDESISPQYMIVRDDLPETTLKIKKKIGFPLVVKPTGLAASILVTICYHEEELQKVLKMTLRKIRTVYRKKGRLTEPEVLVEEFMEGAMYSTDIYVDGRGQMAETPLVHIKTAFNVGKDDFYGYIQTTPVILNASKHPEAFRVAKRGMEALGLRNITGHVELMSTEEGWKIIEIAPRLGGFREYLYGAAFKIDHAYNDIAIRLPIKTEVSSKALGFAAVMKIYPDEEGAMKGLKGVMKLKALQSYVKSDQNKGAGDKLLFARNGGGSVIDIYLFSKDRSDLLADIRRIEQTVSVTIEPKRPIQKLTDAARQAVDAIGI